LDIQQLNLRLVEALKKWDPFQLGEDFYDTEIVDVVQEVHQLDDANQLAKEIQRIYEFSFEQVIPLEACIQIAKNLLLIKEKQSCEL
jgi:hypothetical protein